MKHARITWGLSLVTIFTLTAAFAAISVALDRYQQHQFDDALIRVAHSEAAEAPANGFSFTARPGPAANDVGPLEKYGVIFNSVGQVLGATQPFDTQKLVASDLRDRPPSEVPFDFTFQELHLRGVLVSISGYPEQRLLLAASRDDLDGDSRFVRQAMAISLVVAVGWMIGAIRWLVRRNMREHERIAETLHRIARGDTAARVSGNVSDNELRRVGSDIDGIADQLAHLVEDQQRFITHAAHELRSPLAALHGELQQALRKERSANDYQLALASALRASHRLTRLTDALLELARADDKHREGDTDTTAPTGVRSILEEVRESIDTLAKEKNIRVNIAHGDPDAADCFAAVSAASDLERILRNLLDNAIRYAPEGSTVSIDVESSRSSITIRVRDQGKGVAPEERELVFEPFYRSPQARADARGSGLGLAIARQLARKNGGDVNVMSTFDERGSSAFVVSLRNATRTTVEGDG